MNQLIRILFLVLVLALSLPTNAFAQTDMTVGGCPDGFHPHAVMDHDDHMGHKHQHVGTDADQNGDGYICVKHAGLDGNVHVHIDNPIPVR